MSERGKDTRVPVLSLKCILCAIEFNLGQMYGRPLGDLLEKNIYT